MPDGCLVVYKPKGCTSHDIIGKMRRAYRVKCGHAGTLDPMAQGVLLVFCDKALKILNFLPGENLDKAYLMRVTLGTVTDTYDATGKVVATYDKPVDFGPNELMTHLRSLVGSYEQMPPAFSAIKVDGKRAYAMARAGEEVVLKPRKVHVSSIRLVRDYVENSVRHLLLRVHCARGTYVRSIAHDLGQKLGCGAHLSYLLRERVGKWVYSEAFPTWKIEKKMPFEDSPAFIKFEDILPFPRLHVTEEGVLRVSRGQSITRKEIARLETDSHDLTEHLQIIAPDGRLIAIYGPGKSNPDAPRGALRLSPLRVFSENEA